MEKINIGESFKGVSTFVTPFLAFTLSINIAVSQAIAAETSWSVLSLINQSGRIDSAKLLKEGLVRKIQVEGEDYEVVHKEAYDQTIRELESILKDSDNHYTVDDFGVGLGCPGDKKTMTYRVNLKKVPSSNAKRIVGLRGVIYSSEQGMENIYREKVPSWKIRFSKEYDNAEFITAPKVSYCGFHFQEAIGVAQEK